VGSFWSAMDRLLARTSRRQSAGSGSDCPGNRRRPRETKKATGGVRGCQPSEFWGRRVAILQFVIPSPPRADV